LNILHVITGLDNGGAEAALYRLVTSDARHTHHVVGLMDNGVYGDRLVRAGIGLDTLRMPRGLVTPAGVIRLYRLMRSLKPDIVQTWMYHADLVGGLLARIAGMKNIIWGIRGPFDRERTALSTKTAVKLCALLSRWVPRVIVCNSMYAIEAHIRAGYSARKFINIPNGCPITEYRPDPTARTQLLREFDLGEGVFLIGMIARFDSHKDHENLFGALSRVAQRVPGLTCLLVGNGMSMTNERLVRLVRKYRLEGVIKLLGQRDDIPRIMAALDIHVLSSVAESFPNVLAEAMACGTPCVTCDVGDAAVIVGDTGWVVPRSDTIALADAIVNSWHEMQDPNISSARKKACRNRIHENYSLERMVASYTHVWMDLAGIS